ncbi:MAG: tRNA uridine-5-carboxymethylaminomethyl(34) synthesis GTPase MnmE, partial [Mariprofundaceae bacterium]|nr:tRNA uridine-5-carboxymethylaminomethyl(34) synthesis GTPase MnmE [Mariprofundaceae bacterium]
KMTIPGKFILISVHDGSGMDQLINGMAVFLGDIPEGEEGVLVSRQRHRQLIDRARSHLLAGRGLLGEASMLDVAALEWRQAWTCLGEVLGMGDVEHILDKIFSEFCIGK